MDLLRLIRISNFLRVWIADRYNTRYTAYHRFDEDRFINEKTWTVLSTLELYEELYTSYYLDEVVIDIDAYEAEGNITQVTNNYLAGWLYR